MLEVIFIRCSRLVPLTESGHAHAPQSAGITPSIGVLFNSFAIVYLGYAGLARWKDHLCPFADAS
jgi:hypothetical protein